MGHRQRPVAVCGAVILLASSVVLSVAVPSVQAATLNWYKADLHVHSVYSADARPDLGIVAHNAAAAGYNAIFVTDHNLASSFPINSLTANHLVLEDSYTRWTAASSGSLSSSVNAFATSPVHSGSSSLHLAATSSTAGQAFAWATRGPNFSSGDAIVKFSVYPIRIDAGSSLYISASIGGDPAVKTPSGFTTAAGTVSPGRSEVFVWFFGSAPPTSLFPGSTVRAKAIPASACDRAYAPGAWISCTIDLNSALAGLSTSDLADAHDAWTDLKVAAAGAGGTAEGYFDSYSIDATAPVAAGDEFVARNRSLSLSGTGPYDSASLHLFPSIELGIGDHTQRFNFGISDPAQNLWYQHGTDGIPVTEASGYPAQLNHPGVAGGVTEQEAIDSNGEGAEAVEVRQPVMIETWDGILAKGVPIVGTWGTDNHNANWGSGSQATVLAAPSMSFDALMRSLYEGTVYLSTVGFGGRVVLNLACTTSPYPTRYPVFVSGSATSATACLNVTGGIATGSSVAWISGGRSIATDAASGSYAAARTVPLGAGSTYVRAEVRTGSGTQAAMSEAMLFTKVSGLPLGMSFHVDGVTTPSGRGYTLAAVRGITGGTWNATTAALTATLVNPVGSLSEFEMSTAGATPAGVQVGGVAAARASSLDAFNAATASTWFYDSSARIVHVKASQTASSTTTVVGFSTTTGGGTPSPSTTVAPTPAPSGATLTFSPVADAYVRSDQPTTNFGTSTALRVDGSPVIRSYLRFSVAGLGGAVSRATLRVYATSAQSPGYDAWPVASTTWGETSITYGNAPPLGTTKAGSSGAVAISTWTSVDVTRLITGNGTYSIAISTTGSTALGLASRESATRPQLVVTASGTAPNPTPTPTAAPSTPPPPSPGPTASPTPATGTATVKPAADAYVTSAYPSTNYGTLTALRVDGSPVITSYLRFSVTGLSGSVAKATLRVYANTAQSLGYDVWPVSNLTWGETTITYGNAPARGTAKIGSTGPVTAGTWVSVDVTKIVVGNGTYSIALSTASSTALSLGSRESGTPPQLVIVTQ